MAAAGPEAERRGGPALGVGRTVLREQVKNALLQRILAGQYAPGERLVKGRPFPLKSWNTVQFHERRKAGWPALRSAFAQLSQR